MKLQKQYEQYVDTVAAHASLPALPYVEWLESLVLNSVVNIEVSGGVAEMAGRSSRHIWIVIKDYDNTEDRDGNEQEYSEEVYVGWLNDS